MQYVTLSASGIGQGGFDCGVDQYKQPDSTCHTNQLNKVHELTGQFGLNTGFTQNIYPNCMSCNRH